MKKLFLLGVLVLGFLNCEQTEDDDSALACNDVICTLELRTLSVNIKNTSDAAIALDDFEVIDTGANKDVTIPLNISELENTKQTGRYPLYNDTFVMGNRNTRKNLIFKGYVDGVKIVESTFEIDIDCCHISLGSGDLDIIVN